MCISVCVCAPNSVHQAALPFPVTAPQVTHVVSHLDIVRVLAANKASLGGMAEASLEALGLDEGAVFCVPAATPALEAFQRMAADHKSCLGLVDPDTGKLVRGGLAAGGGWLLGGWARF